MCEKWHRFQALLPVWQSVLNWRRILWLPIQSHLEVNSMYINVLHQHTLSFISHTHVWFHIAMHCQNMMVTLIINNHTNVVMVLNGGNNDMMMLVMMMMLREVAYSLTHACVYMNTNCIHCIHHPLCISQCSKLTNFSAGSKKTQTLVKYYVFFRGKLQTASENILGPPPVSFTWYS